MKPSLPPPLSRSPPVNPKAHGSAPHALKHERHCYPRFLPFLLAPCCCCCCCCCAAAAAAAASGVGSAWGRIAQAGPAVWSMYGAGGSHVNLSCSKVFHANAQPGPATRPPPATALRLCLPRALPGGTSPVAMSGKNMEVMRSNRFRSVCWSVLNFRHCRAGPHDNASVERGGGWIRLRPRPPGTRNQHRLPSPAGDLMCCCGAAHFAQRISSKWCQAGLPAPP